MRRIKDAFEKPFRNNATSALGFEKPTQKGKGRATEDNAGSDGAEWDIELDLNQSPEPEPRSESSNRRKRSPSPVWDIELDLNDSDVEDEVAPRKKHKPDK